MLENKHRFCVSNVGTYVVHVSDSLCKCLCASVSCSC